jgi:glucose-6-phosphate 1-epimerase
LISPDGAQLTVCAHGGHVLGWTPAGGQPRLWLSPAAECGPGLAIRGGIPVIFPQFAGRGPLPKHGLARNRGWQVEESADGTAEGSRDSAAVWRATLTDDAATREIWPFGFELSLTARAAGDRLDITLTARNTGNEAWTFTAALHTYLAVGDPGAAIHGLSGRLAEDNAAAGRAVTLAPDGEPLRATTGRDVAVIGSGGPVTLEDPALGRLVMSTEGFGDLVVWNPGPGHGLSDVPDGDERNFVCIEAAQLNGTLVKPTSSWEGRQTLRARSI